MRLDLRNHWIVGILLACMVGVWLGGPLVVIFLHPPMYVLYILAAVFGVAGILFVALALIQEIREKPVRLKRPASLVFAFLAASCCGAIVVLTPIGYTAVEWTVYVLSALALAVEIYFSARWLRANWPKSNKGPFSVRLQIGLVFCFLMGFITVIFWLERYNLTCELMKHTQGTVIEKYIGPRRTFHIMVRTPHGYTEYLGQMLHPLWDQIKAGDQVNKEAWHTLGTWNGKRVRFLRATHDNGILPDVPDR